jgi:hypothetical protein
MKTQNIILSLPKCTIREIRKIAALRHISVSSLLSELLEQIAGQETGYNCARQRQLASMEKGFDLGTGGAISSRQALHKR